MDAVLFGSIVGGFVGIIIALIKIVEYLIIKKRNGKTNNIECSSIEYKINHIYSIINKVDNNGIPFCYMPRSILDTHKDIISILNQIHGVQYNVLQILKHIERNKIYAKRKRE